MTEKEDAVFTAFCCIFTALAVIFLLWVILSVLPAPAFHSHTESCYDNGTAICGKEESELYFTRSRIPGPLETIDRIESARIEKQKSMTDAEVQAGHRKNLLISITAILLCGIPILRKNRPSGQKRKETSHE